MTQPESNRDPHSFCPDLEKLNRSLLHFYRHQNRNKEKSKLSETFDDSIVKSIF